MLGGTRLRGGTGITRELATWQRTLRRSLADAALSTTLQTLTTGVFIAGFGLAIGASQLQIGILAALPTLGNIAQIVGSYLIERTGQRKSLCLVSTLVARLLWFAILGLPFITLGARVLLVWCVVAALALSSMFAAVGGVAWLSWMKDLVPNACKADFLSRRNQIGTGLALSLSVVAGLFLDWCELRGVGSLTGFAWVFGFAAACGVAAVAFLRSTPDAPMPARDPYVPFMSLLSLPVRDLNFRRLVMFYVFWNFGVNLASPFFNVYMLRELDCPFWFVTLVTTLAGVASLVTNRFWVRLSSEFGHKPVVFLATLGNAFFPLCWVFIDRPWYWLLVPVHLLGMFNSVLALGPNNIMFKLAPDRNASAYLAVFNAAIGPATALAPVLGGLLSSTLASVHWSIGATEIAGVKFIFLCSFVLRLSSLVLLRFVTEPDAEAVRHVVRVVRRAKITDLFEGVQIPLRGESPANRQPHQIPTPHFSPREAVPASVGGETRD